MTVYVDDMKAHMVADSTEELLEMADRIGVARQWIQKPGTPWEHFDVSKGKRALAVAAGAVEVTSRELVGIRRAKREAIERRRNR